MRTSADPLLIAILGTPLERSMSLGGLKTVPPTENCRLAMLSPPFTVLVSCTLTAKLCPWGFCRLYWAHLERATTPAFQPSSTDRLGLPRFPIPRKLSGNGLPQLKNIRESPIVDHITTESVHQLSKNSERRVGTRPSPTLVANISSALLRGVRIHAPASHPGLAYRSRRHARTFLRLLRQSPRGARFVGCPVEPECHHASHQPS